MITLQDVQAARERIVDITYVTPILKSEQLSKICDNQIFLKAEHLQKTAPLKFAVQPIE